MPYFRYQSLAEKYSPFASLPPDQAEGGVLDLGVGADPVKPAPAHRPFPDILQAGEAHHLDVAGASTELRVVHAREDIADVGGEDTLAAEIDVARLGLVELQPTRIDDL